MNTTLHSPGVKCLMEAVLDTPGETSGQFRGAIEQRAAELGGRATSEHREVPEDLADYVDKVATRAYEVDDVDVEALKLAGYSEDAIFEITLSAALGASVSRLERGLASVRGIEA